MMTLMKIVIFLTMFSVTIRLIRGKSVWEKLLALNLFAVLTIMLIITYAVDYQLVLVMDVAIAYSIIGFLSIILITKFVSNGGRDA